nr:hypothetical protein [Tanacetum cinerariifolium]
PLLQQEKGNVVGVVCYCCSAIASIRKGKCCCSLKRFLVRLPLFILGSQLGLFMSPYGCCKLVTANNSSSSRRVKKMNIWPKILCHSKS